MSVFLLFAVPAGALAFALTLLYLNKDRSDYDDRTPGERKFFTGSW